MYIIFFSQSSRYHPDLHSFPTRRSSDLFWNEAPKSPTLVSPYCESRMLPGLMSRWITPCWNAYSSARMHLKRSEEHTSELQSHSDLVCRLLLEKKKKRKHERAHIEQLDD